MTDPLTAWWRHDVQVERYTGSASTGGDAYDAPVTVRGFYSDDTLYAGTEVIATGRFAYPASVAVIPPQSRLTLPAAFDNRTGRVVESRVADGGGLATPDHRDARVI